MLHVCIQDNSDSSSNEDSDSETPAPEALARYLAIRRSTATGGATVTTGALSAGAKMSHGIVDNGFCLFANVLFRCIFCSSFFV